MPLNGGNFQRLSLLAPGASGGGNNNPAFSGSRNVANSYTLDSGGFNDERGALGGTALGGGAADFGNPAPSLISTEAIREFRVITSNADATFGRGSPRSTSSRDLVPTPIVPPATTSAGTTRSTRATSSTSALTSTPGATP